MTTPAVLVVVFAAVALGLAAFSLFVSWGARKDARQALAASHSHVRTPNRPPEGPVERRDENFGPPDEQPERRRHRAPDTGALYSRLRASADVREAHEPADDATTAIPVVRPGDELETAEHPAPTGLYRRPPPPLPPPGAIGRPQ